MTKLEIAANINFEGDVYRTILVDDKIDFKVGQIIDNVGMSWCDQYGTFFVESERKYKYFFRCEKPVKGHAVDYENEEECEVLGATGCENECEVLILPSQKFKIINVSSNADYEEMRYYDIELEPFF